jgi:hypothetical protein
MIYNPDGTPDGITSTDFGSLAASAALGVGGAAVGVGRLAVVGARAALRYAAKRLKKALCKTCNKGKNEEDKSPGQQQPGDNKISSDKVIGDQPVPDGVNRDTEAFRSIRGEEIGPDGRFMGSSEGSRYAFWNVSPGEASEGMSLYDGKPMHTTVGELMDNGVRFEPRWDNQVILHYPDGGLPPGVWKP